MVDQILTKPLQAPTRYGLHPRTQVGEVHLTVSNLTRSISFYERSLGLKLLSMEAERAELGAGGRVLLYLYEVPGAVRAPGRTGLYHYAILVPSRLALAYSLKRLIDTKTRMQGFADHLVSEALYLADPDGNGIEIYRDRPREEWRSQQGQLVMDTLPLDLQGILDELGDEADMPNVIDPETVIGHMHLHVADIAAAERFYCDVLGFELMASLGTADFVATGGYHHNIGFNIWNGLGAPPPPTDSIGLRYFSLRLPSPKEIERLALRLIAANTRFDLDNQGLWVRDPSRNLILFTVEQT
jgi:catechol 2,3-dioxygenase